MKLRDEYNLISKRIATYVSSREDILSEHQFVKLKLIEKNLQKSIQELKKFNDDIEKYKMNYVQIKSILSESEQALVQLKTEVVALQELSTDTLEKHLTKTLHGKE